MPPTKPNPRTFYGACLVLLTASLHARAQDKLPPIDKAKALQYLARVDFELAQTEAHDDALMRLGKRIGRLQTKLDELLPQAVGRQASRADGLIPPGLAGHEPRSGVAPLGGDPELLRGVADSLGCPMPPLLPGQPLA